MKTKYLGLMASVGLVCAPGLAAADDAAAPAAPAGPTLSNILVNSGITAAGYISASYEATFNSTNGATLGSVPFHEFDNNANSFMLNQGALTLSYLPTSGFGGLVNVIAGEDAKVINGSYGDGAGDFALTQAYVSYATGNLTVIGGRYVTLAGAEVIDDTKNNNISRSLLFTNMEPLVHTGIRASYAFNSLVTGYAGVNDSAFAFPTTVIEDLVGAGGSGASLGFATAGQDTDKHKTAEVGAAITPSKTIAVNVVDYYGYDNATSSGGGSATTRNNVLDIVATWQVTPAIALGINGDYDILGITGPGGATFDAEGVALYASDQVTDSFKASFRGEFMRVGLGSSGIDVGAHLAEVTLTGDYSVAKDFDVLGEIRDDYGSMAGAGADSGIFPGPSGVTPLFPSGANKSQPEVLIKAIFKFGTPVASS
jgi:hypothetical protein